MGYEEEHARDYVVAACWEFIIPKYGAEIVNIGALSFPKVIDTVIRKMYKGELTANSYDELCSDVKEEINEECRRIIAEETQVKGDRGLGNRIHPWFIPSPLMEAMIEPKYFNFGLHGTGIATAADSLAAIRKYVFEEGSLTLDRFVKAIDSDFDGEEELLHRLRYDTPKMGQNEEYPDSAAVFLLDSFADALKGRKNPFGGIWRAGTGSAMYYLSHAAQIKGSCDGRRVGEPFGANYSPSLFARTSGPFSVIASFTKPDLGRVCNGGPLTMEFSSSLFDTEEGIKKTAGLVQSFIKMGGHQLQLNSVNGDILRKAQSDPEAYRGLIVRIWGWSAYFTELDREYQDHVIARREYTV